MASSARSSKNRESQDSSELKQLTHLCFNVYGHAYEHGILDRQENVTIVTYAPSSKNHSTRMNELQKLNTELMRPSLEATDREKGQPDPPSTIKCILVGLLPAGLSPKVIHSNAAGSKKRKPVGLEEPLEKYRQNEETVPLRVVTEITETEPPGGSKLYALMDQEKGICHPYIVSQKDVFYFSEFRENTTNIEGRKTSWNKLVKAQSIRAQDPVTLSEKQITFKRAKDTTKVICEPTRSFANEVAFLTAAFAINHDTSILAKLKDILQLGDDDLDSKPLPANKNLHAFVNQEGKFGLEEAQGVVDEVALLWPELEIKGNHVLSLKKGLSQADVVLEYRLLRGFLVHGCNVLTKRQQQTTPPSFIEASNEINRDLPPTTTTTEDTDDESLGVLVRDVQETVAGIIGDVAPSRSSIQLDHMGTLIAALVTKLKEICLAGKETSMAITNLNGDQIMAESLADIFETFGKSLESDTAKLAFSQALRYAFGLLAQKHDFMGRAIEEVVTLLERLNIPVVE